MSDPSRQPSDSKAQITETLASGSDSVAKPVVPPTPPEVQPDTVGGDGDQPRADPGAFSPPPTPNVPMPNERWPLLGERRLRRSAIPELAANRERQSRYCQGYAPDFWLPALACPKWRTWWYPLYPTPESIEQWLAFIEGQRLEYLGPLDNPIGAKELEADQANDVT